MGRIRLTQLGRFGLSLTLNPDLVFDRALAVGDVKYKALDPEWSRADLYQSVAFAAGYECDCAAVIGFNDGRLAGPPPVRFGKIGVEAFGWDMSPLSTSEASGEALAGEIAAFLTRAARRRAALSAA